MVAIQISKFKEYIIQQVRLFKFIATVCFVLALLVGVQYSVFSDKHKDLVENFIEDSSVVKNSVGAVQSMKLTKITSVGLNISNEKAYKKYFYTVKGTKSRVKLIAVLTQKNSEFFINVINIKKADLWW